MAFSDILQKMADGQTLSPAEKDELYLKARQIEQAEALFTSLIQPGTKNMQINRLLAEDVSISNGNTSLDDNGITIKPGVTKDGKRAYNFVSSDGIEWGGLYGYGQQDDTTGMEIDSYGTNTNSNGEISLNAASPAGLASSIGLQTKVDNVVKSNLSVGNNSIDVFPSLKLKETYSSTNDPIVYFKSTFLIVKYDDAGTIRYKYLDLSGTGVTWVHTTVAP